MLLKCRLVGGNSHPAIVYNPHKASRPGQMLAGFPFLQCNAVLPIHFGGAGLLKGAFENPTLEHGGNTKVYPKRADDLKDAPADKEIRHGNNQRMHDGPIRQKSWHPEIIRMQFDASRFAPPDFNQVANAQNSIDQKKSIKGVNRNTCLFIFPQVRFDLRIDGRIVRHEKDNDVKLP